MKLDEFNCMITHGPRPGCLGDSCAETARYILIGGSLPREVLLRFRTQDGYLRSPSPDLPQDWRETDFVTDQAIPLYLAFLETGLTVHANEMKERIKAAGWKLGNGDLISPAFWALLNGKKWFLSSLLYGQSLIFSFPYRWDDGKGKFAKSEGSSCDYLNFYFLCKEAYPWARRRVSKDKMKEKVLAYYKDEIEAEQTSLGLGELIYALYCKELDSFWT